jgi:hypothetical protein
VDQAAEVKAVSVSARVFDDQMMNLRVLGVR